jgi:pyruvate kinase
LRPDVITALTERGVDLFRINLSHTPLEAISETIGLVRAHSSVPIAIDTEGAQVRCGKLASDLVLVEGQRVRMEPEDSAGPGADLTLRPRVAFDALRAGNHLSVDFDGVVIRVTRVREGVATGRVVHGGRVKSNRAVNIDPAPPLPPMTEKDIAAFAIASEQGIMDFALSFAAGPDDVALVRGYVPSGARVISKIESRAGVRNMDGIIMSSDAVLIDRGDLSREVPLELVPFYQKVIVRQANRWHKPAYVATNLLESMVNNRKPTVAEANDIANTLLDGVHGLVLAAETAVGVDPVGAVDMIRRSIAAFERSAMSPLLGEDRADAAGNF